MRTSDNISAIADALAKAQGEIQNPNFNKVNPHFKSKYADLSSVLNAVRPALSKHGIALMQMTGLEDSGVVLYTRLTHSSVDWTVADLILRKGTRQQVDSYSAFRENHGPDGERPATGLAGWLHERRIREVHVCGLARDYCVLWSAQDAVKSGFRVKFLWELTRPVTEANDAMVREALGKAGIAII